jgi:predicted nucleotidyltransferase
MDREHVLKILTKHQIELAEIGVKSLAVFGSVARGEADAESDIDILVDFHQTPVTFDGYMDVKIYLEDLLDVPVDLVVSESLHPRVKPFVHQDAVYVT